MSETTFFVRGRNRGNERKVILSSATLLVGKAPTKEKRIKMKVRMPLDGSKPAGTPDWITNAMTFVAQSHDVVSPQVEFKGFEILMNDDNLFEEAKTRAQKCSMRGFVVHECGDGESPDVEMAFLVYAPFSDRLWRFCGQMGGEEFWMQFTQVAEAQDDNLELTGEDEESEEEEEG